METATTESATLESATAELVDPTQRVPGRAVAMVLRLAAALGLLAYLVYSLPTALARPAGSDSNRELLFCAVLAAGAALCFMRGVISTRQRLPWVLLAVGLGSWSYGEFLLTTAPGAMSGFGGLSLGDVATLAFYPCAYAALLLLLRASVDRFSALLWLDGLAGALAVSAVVAVFAFRPVLASSAGSTATVIANMSYPLADLLLIAVVIFSLATTGWRPGSLLGWLCGGLLSIALADGFSLWWTSTGHARATTPVDTLWPLGVLLIAQSALRPVRVQTSSARGMLTPLIFPVGFSLIALALLLSGLVRSLNASGYELATSALAFLVLRMIVTAARNLQMTAASRREALTDALTALGNRRKLMLDLEAATTKRDRRSEALLILFDLDGFKLYNDTFGHPAGDALLARLGRALREQVESWGEVYRLGGDEFCVLSEDPPPDYMDALPGTLDALSERGTGFAVTASYGSVLIPSEASDVTLALQTADQRLYVQKGDRKRGSDTQLARDVLIQALRERDAGLPEHLGGVAILAQAVARRLELTAEEIDQVTRAAELHDIGKMAVPQTILDKPAPLDKDELALMRQHTIIGERILAAAPALRPVGKLVRSSHEHFDGSGYPDGLVGDEIPLGARIIIVCDAYDAMTSERPYRRAVSAADALAELRRCAGTQFDPAVVQAFCEEAPGAAVAEAVAVLRGR